MLKKVMFLSVYFCSPLLLIAAIYHISPGYYGAKGFLPMVLGTAAYTWLNAQLIISARPKWIEKSFGLDRFYQFHGIMAIVAIFIAYIHKLLQENSFSESLKTKLGDFALILYIAAAVLALVFLIDTLTIWIKPLKTARLWLKKLKVGNYNIQVLLHNINFVAVVLLFIHVMMTYSAKDMLVKSLYILYFDVSTGFYLYHKFVRRFFSTRFVIDEVKTESDAMCTLTLHSKDKKTFRYLPGQFGFLRVMDGAVSSEAHPFSFSSGGYNDEKVTVTIKNLGDWTKDVPAIKTGSDVLIDGPYGRFSPLRYPADDGIVLIAGGVGVTPMLSMIRYYGDADRNKKIALFWGVNTSGELICKEEIDSLLKVMPNFKFIPVVASDVDFDGEKGFITEELLNKHLANLEYDTLQFFFCGPVPMWKHIKRILASMKIKRKRIHYESFSL